MPNHIKSFLCLILLILSNSLYAQKILFVGNSLTYSNDLPGMIEDLGKAFEMKIETQCLCFPNYGLEDHWNDGAVQRLLGEGDFDFVVFQQGPSSQAYGRSSLLEFGGHISKLARQNDTEPAYFMVWPAVRYYQTFEGVIKNHTDAANTNRAKLIPVGIVWRKYREERQEPSLYASDNFHPSRSGSLLASLLIFKKLFPETQLQNLKFNAVRKFIDKSTFEFMMELISK